MLETLSYTIRIGSTPTFLYFDLHVKYICSLIPKQLRTVYQGINMLLKVFTLFTYDRCTFIVIKIYNNF